MRILLSILVFSFSFFLYAEDDGMTQKDFSKKYSYDMPFSEDLIQSQAKCGRNRFVPTFGPMAQTMQQWDKVINPNKTEKK